MLITRAVGWPLHMQVPEWWFSQSAPLLNATVSRPDYLDFFLVGASETCSAYDTTICNLAQLEGSKSKEQLQKNTMVFIAKMSGMKLNMVLLCSRQKTKEANIEMAQCMEKNFWVALYKGVHLIFMWLLLTEQIFVTVHIIGTHPANRTGKNAMWHHNFQMQTQHKNGWNTLV
jgi:hypothetical protein